MSANLKKFLNTIQLSGQAKHKISKLIENTKTVNLKEYFSNIKEVIDIDMNDKLIFEGVDGELGKISISNFLQSLMNEQDYYYNKNNLNSQLNTNGIKYADFGLPSGNLWAKSVFDGDHDTIFSIGVDIFDIYLGQWGDTYGDSIGYIINDKKDVFTENSYKNKNLDIITNLYPDNDIISYKLGGDWCIPSAEDFNELMRYTINNIVTINNKKYISIHNDTNRTAAINIPLINLINEDDDEIKPIVTTDNIILQTSSLVGNRYSSIIYDTVDDIIESHNMLPYRWQPSSILPVCKKH